MPFMLPDNPALRERHAPRFVPQTYETDGRRFEETPEFRLAREGEFVLAPLGVAQVNQATSVPFRILREIPAMRFVAICECNTPEGRIAIPKRTKAAKEMENHARNAYAAGSALKHDDYTIEGPPLKGNVYIQR